MRALVSVGALLAIVVVVWVWPRGEPPSSDDSPTILTSTVPPDGGEPALRPLVPPGRATLPSGAAASVTPPPSAGPGPAFPPVVPAATRPATSQPSATADPAQAQADFQTGLKACQRGGLLTARTYLNRALHAALPPDQARRARKTLADLADRTIFSRGAIKDDPLVDHYVVQKGDALGKIARQFKVSEDFLARINGITNKHFIRDGKRLKVVHGPFHAAITRPDHLMHVYLQDVYVRTYRVALGANGATPTGWWKVANRQKNPSWTDPRTGKRWYADDPQNPIGEYWIGLAGFEGDALGQFGYGIHGTIEPETIGQDVSMGCVRLAPEDIASLYQLLVPGESLVTVTD